MSATAALFATSLEPLLCFTTLSGASGGRRASRVAANRAGDAAHAAVAGGGARVGLAPRRASSEEMLQAIQSELGWAPAPGDASPNLDLDWERKMQEQFLEPSKRTIPKVQHSSWKIAQAPTRTTEVLQLSTEAFAQGQWSHSTRELTPIVKAVWDLFDGGKSPAAIAKERKCKVATVVKSLLEACQCGASVDLRRLARAAQPLTRKQWETMESAADAAKIDVGASDFKASELLREILGPLDDASKTAKDEAEEQDWREKIDWFCALRRVNFPVSFGPSAETWRPA